MMVLLGEMITAGAEGGEGWVAAPRAGIPHGPETSSWALPVQTLHRAQGGWWLLCWALSSSSSRKGTHSTRVSRATSPAATLLLTVRGNSTLTAFISKIPCSSSSPSRFCKEDICFCFSCPERNNSGSWRVTEQHPRQAIIFCPSYLL